MTEYLEFQVLDINLGALLNSKAAVSCRLEFVGMVIYISVCTGFVFQCFKSDTVHYEVNTCLFSVCFCLVDLGRLFSPVLFFLSEH